MTPRHAEIAGAGFAGLTVATALSQRGWTARVHEVSPELRDFGAGIFIWENGLRVLQALGAYADVVGGAHEAPGYEGRNARNERISYEVFGPRRGTRMLTMTRQHLYAAMLAAAERAGVEFITRSEVIAARPEGELVTADGRAWRGDLVVGADGVRSSVRRSLGLEPRRTSYRFGIIRLLVPRGEHDLQATDPDHVINFWSPEHRILYVPCNPRELYLAMAARDTDPLGTALPVRKDVWTAAFPFLAHIIERIGEEGRYDTYETARLGTWSVGRVALVGDSVHAMPPTLGQGAGCAMMNGLALAAIVAEADDVATGLRRWEAQEHPLTDLTQEISSRYAATRAGSDGASKWNADALRAARHVPTCTAEHKIRVVAPDVGGGFGMKIVDYPEDPPVLWASKLTGRPVRWTATRHESLLTDAHGRDHATTCRMAFAADGRILAIWVDTIASLGAYQTHRGASIPAFFYGPLLAGLYLPSDGQVLAGTFMDYAMPRASGLGEGP